MTEEKDENKKRTAANYTSDEYGKKIKLSNSRINGFNSLKEIKVLNNLKEKKVLFLEGKIQSENDEESAVVILEKRPFEDNLSVLSDIVATANLELDLQNDIYSTFTANITSSLNTVKATLIHPATSKHIEKYKQTKHFLVEETGEQYKNITEPYLEDKNQFSVKWVENILDKKSESERIVFEDPNPETGFILLPDMKWDGKMETLYLIAIVHNRTLKSIRDLTSEHIPLLENVLHKGKNAIMTKYTISSSNLRIYFHYQPSYYHLHVHFTHNSFDAPGVTVTRAHLLTDVIENIKFKSSYYQEKTLTYSLREKTDLLQLLGRTTQTETS